MGQAGPFLRTVGCVAYRGYSHWCPGCEEAHTISTERLGDWTGPCWTFNGNLQRPDFKPSVRITYNGADAGQDRGDGFGRAPPACCHYFINDGNIQFCGDSTHALAGQTVPLPPLPEHLRD